MTEDKSLFPLPLDPDLDLESIIKYSNTNVFNNWCNSIRIHFLCIIVFVEKNIFFFFF